MTPARVLVVDDEVGLCLVLKDALELEGYEVDVCHDAASAREKLCGRWFDLAMIDVFLTDEPVGLQLGEYIMLNHPKTGVVFITGYAEESDVAAGVASGAFTCIRKPFVLDDVVRAVGGALG